MKRVLVLVITILLISGCARKLPTFAHVHVGHSLSAWINTPNKVGLFTLSEQFGLQMKQLASGIAENAKKNQYSAVQRDAAKLLDLLGEVGAPIQEPESYRFITAFQGAYDHLSYARLSNDATLNLHQGLEGLSDHAQAIFVRAELIRTLAEALALDSDSMVEVSEELLRQVSFNYDGSETEYGLRQMRDELSEILSRENPRYTAPEKRYLFGVIRLPDGTWFWRFKSSGAGGGSYDDSGGGGGGGGGGY